MQILRKRADGYHDIATVMYPVNWCDILEITPSGDNDTHLTVTGNTVDCPIEKNLVYKAYQIVKNEFPELPAVDIHLHKIIPDGAGLGGGSSDASFTIKMLNEMFKLNMTEEKMAQSAKTIGADCPFFIYNRPVIATGIGEIFTETDIDLSEHKILIVKPLSAVSTKEAYSGVTPNDNVPQISDIIHSDINTWKNCLVNDFEKSLFPNHPEIKSIKEKMYKSGAEYASMTGSGAAVFGIFKTAEAAENAAEQFDGLACHIM